MMLYLPRRVTFACEGLHGHVSANMLASANTYEGIHTCSGHKNRRSGRNSVYDVLIIVAVWVQKSQIDHKMQRMNDVYGSSRVQTYVCLCTADTRGVETSHYNLSTKKQKTDRK